MSSISTVATAQHPRRTSLRAAVITQLIAFVFCLVPGALVSLILPLNYTRLSYDGAQVTVKSTRLLYLVIPSTTSELRDVVEVDTHKINASTRWDRQSRRQRDADDEGELILRGAGGTLTIPISPASMDDAAAQIEAFLQRPTPAGTWLIAVANWKFTMFLAIPLGLLGLFYMVCCVLAVGKWVLQRALRRA